jgi:AmmeMemoRadiSam system protein B
MNTPLTVFAIGLVLAGCFNLHAESPSPPTRAEIEAEMGLRSEGDMVRGQRDTIGFVVTAEQAEDVVATAVRLEQDAIEERDRALGLSPQHGFIGGVCPHDDHLYAARAYVHLTERITAPRVVLIGVFHAARLWDLQDVLVFDAFENWHGPWKPVTVDPLREQVIAGLAEASYVVDNAMHDREHSLEAIVPFLQYRNREVSILPILVPYASWDRLSELADELSTVLAQTMEKNGWRLGRDLAIVVSSDAVHYGPDFDHAPFGTDAAGYQKAVDRDVQLAMEYLADTLEADKLAQFEYTLVDSGNVRGYKLPWCGRFSVPFGLELLRDVAEKTGIGTPDGHFLRYATSLSEPQLPVSQETLDAGLGTTAPSNLHHWVGYATVGFTSGVRR